MLINLYSPVSLAVIRICCAKGHDQFSEKDNKDKSRANTMMLIATLILFAASTGSSVIDIAGTITTIRGIFFQQLDISLEDKFPAINLSQNIFSGFGTCLSNVIVRTSYQTRN